MPTQNQTGQWNNWISALEREVKAAKQLLHARHRKQAMAEAKEDRGKTIEKKRLNGQIKQAARFALRQLSCYNTGGGVVAAPPHSRLEKNDIWTSVVRFC